MTTDARREPAPNPHATEEQVRAAHSDPKLANVVYHDWVAETYDEKWSISFDQRGIEYAVGSFRAVAGDSGPYPTALELGCGTGFFLLNLMRGGVVERGSVTDLSPGMVEVALRHAESLDLEVDGRVSDAERTPYEDDGFDLVVGHAVLHHVPDVQAAMREALRVLKPGGRFVFAGDPTRIGEFSTRRLGRLTWWLTTTLTKLPALASWRRPQEARDESSPAAALEAVVNLHTFDPAGLERFALGAGAVDVRAVPQELCAALLGRPVRSFEAAVPRERLGRGWETFARQAWQRLSWVDEKVLAKVLPRNVFCNVMVTGTKPPGPERL
jgi:ubiquinone/menaquinone biosynthesis C-methylase UbiE